MNFSKASTHCHISTQIAEHCTGEHEADFPVPEELDIKDMVDCVMKGERFIWSDDKFITDGGSSDLRVIDLDTAKEDFTESWDEVQTVTNLLVDDPIAASQLLNKYLRQHAEKDIRSAVDDFDRFDDDYCLGEGFEQYVDAV